MTNLTHTHTKKTWYFESSHWVMKIILKSYDGEGEIARMPSLLGMKGWGCGVRTQSRRASRHKEQHRNKVMELLLVDVS